MLIKNDEDLNLSVIIRIFNEKTRKIFLFDRWYIGMKVNINKSDKEKLKCFFKKYVFTGKKYLFLIIGLIFIGSLVANISPYLYGKMLDSITSGDMNFLVNLIVSYFFITIFTNLCRTSS